jgi:hypothetical protein
VRGLGSQSPDQILHHCITPDNYFIRGVTESQIQLNELQCLALDIILLPDAVYELVWQTSILIQGCFDSQPVLTRIVVSQKSIDVVRFVDLIDVLVDFFCKLLVRLTSNIQHPADTRAHGKRSLVSKIKCGFHIRDVGFNDFAYAIENTT